MRARWKRAGRMWSGGNHLELRYVRGALVKERDQ